MTFPSASDRDAARERVHGLSGEVLRQRFEINDVVSHPIDPVPSRRLLEAAERLTGKSLGTTLPSKMISLRLQAPLAPEEAVQRKASVLHAVRERSSLLERMATQLDEPIRYAYFSDGESFYEVEVQGGREGVEQMPQPPARRSDDPYWLFRLVQVLDLQPGEHVGRLRMRWGRTPDRNDPVVEVLRRLHWEAAQFNRHQGRRSVITLDADWLEERLTEAAQRNLEDAQMLAAAAPIGDSIHLPEPRTTHLLIELYRPTPRFVAGAYSHATYVYVPNPGGLEQVRVTLVYRIDPLDPNNLGSDLHALRAWFNQTGLPGELHDHQYGFGDLQDVLAGMLGHTTDELQFVYPDERTVGP